MQITYDATGRKWEKIGEGNVKTEYINGIEYRDNNLEAVYALDGRIVYDHVGDEYRTEYFRQDHLGNNRLTFCDFNNNGIIEISDDPGTQENELEITHYVLSRYRGSLRQMSIGHLILIFQDYARSSIWNGTEWELVCNGDTG
ncbi:MAG: hypothetical protein MI974_25025 [Chitinophagales bacterium]|nr:hypothetical protein [Chitinophagales bacterium]